MKEEKKEFEKYKYYRIVYNDKRNYSNSGLSKKLYSITKYNPEDYFKPVIEEGGDILEIISDESEFKEHICVSLIVLPFLNKEYKNSIEEKLEDLIRIYNIDNIHFSEIFSRSSPIRNCIEKFLEKYIEIVSVIKMSCLSFSENKIDLLNKLKLKESTNEELFFILFWNLFERIVIIFKNNDIFHLWFEQEYSLDIKAMNRIAQKLLDKLYSGLDYVYSKHPEKYISVLNKDVHFFSKKALLYSSLADLVAYGSNKIKQKIDSGIPIKKIKRNHFLLMKTIKSIFINYSGLPIECLKVMEGI